MVCLTMTFYISVRYAKDVVVEFDATNALSACKCIFDTTYTAQSLISALDSVSQVKII